MDRPRPPEASCPNGGVGESCPGCSPADEQPHWSRSWAKCPIIHPDHEVQDESSAVKGKFSQAWWCSSEEEWVHHWTFASSKHFCLSVCLSAVALFPPETSGFVGRQTRRDRVCFALMMHEKKVKGLNSEETLRCIFYFYTDDTARKHDRLNMS